MLPKYYNEGRISIDPSKSICYKISIQKGAKMGILQHMMSEQEADDYIMSLGDAARRDLTENEEDGADEARS